MDGACACASPSPDLLGLLLSFPVGRGFAPHATDGFTQTLSRLKRGNASRGNDDRLTGFWIASFTTAAFTNYETAERNELHFVAGFERARDLGEHLIDHLTDTALRYIEFSGECINKIRFRHVRTPRDSENRVRCTLRRTNGYTQRTLPLLPSRAIPAHDVCGLFEQFG